MYYEYYTYVSIRCIYDYIFTIIIVVVVVVVVVPFAFLYILSSIYKLCAIEPLLQYYIGIAAPPSGRPLPSVEFLRTTDMYPANFQTIPYTYTSYSPMYI